MPRVLGNIPNFINGISQQPAALRLPSQAQSMTNCYPTVAKGLSKRPALEHVTKISNSQADNAFVHLINRDVTERYVAIVDYSDTQKVRVFDFTGAEATVTFTATTAYVPTVPSTSMAALTVADYTFFVNKSKVVAKDAGTVASRPYEALISFGTVQPGSEINVIVTEATVGTSTYTLAIGDTDPSELDTSYAAGQIVARMQSGAGSPATGPALGANFTSHSLTETAGSVIYLANSTNDFTVTVRDGSNGLGIKVIKDKVQYFEDLPRAGEEGFVVQVAGDPVTSFGSYWVTFENAGIPVWKESAQPGIDNQLDGATLPHTLVNTGALAFTWDEATWDDLAVGDTDTNSFPSFIGETINDIFFTESRLAFLAGESVIMSQAGEFFNFFRTTTTALVDGDPIDVGTNHTKVSILRHAVPYQEQLLLFSDQTQFRLTKGDLLSPSTVGIDPITEFESSIQARPAAVGNFIFFGVEKSDYASVREYYVADDSLRNDAREITGHVPRYLPSGIKRIAGSSNEDVIIMQSSGSAVNELFVYKYFWSGQNKVQSAWGKWSFPDVDAILGFDFIKSTLYVVTKRGDGVHLEKMELDTGSEDDSGTSYDYHLDRKTFSTNADVTGTYYGENLDHTAYTFADIDWDNTVEPVCVGIAGNSATYPVGYNVPFLQFTANLLTKSEALDHADWTKTGAATITQTTLTSPTNTATMDEITFTAGPTDGVLQTYTPDASSMEVGDSWNYAFYYEPTGTAGVFKTKIRFATGGTPEESEITVDTSTNTITVGPTNGGVATITPLNGGFYRVNIGKTITNASNADVEVYITQGASGTFRCWGHYLNSGLTAGYYIGTDATNENEALVYEGDLTADDFAFGIPYTAEYVVSELVAKAPSSTGGGDQQGGGTVPITEARNQLYWLNFKYDDTGYFKVQVDNVGRDANTYVFNGRESSYVDNEVGALPIKSRGSFRVPLLGRSDRITVTVTSDDILPFNLISADWMANLHMKFKRA